MLYADLMPAAVLATTVGPFVAGADHLGAAAGLRRAAHRSGAFVRGGVGTKPSGDRASDL